MEKEEIKNDECYACKQKTIELKRIIKNDLGKIVETQNKTHVCQNKKCSMYIKVEKLKQSWI